MGNFSYIAKNTNRAIQNPWHGHTLCELQLVINSKVVEKMRGIYNGYGSILQDNIADYPLKHEILTHNGQWVDVTEDTKARLKISKYNSMWLSGTWEALVDIHFEKGGTDGFAVWALSSMDDPVPSTTSRSKDDPNQGDVFNDYDEDEDYPDEY